MQGLRASGALRVLVVAAVLVASPVVAQKTAAPETETAEALEPTEGAAPAEDDAAAAAPGGVTGEPELEEKQAPQKTKGIEEIVVIGSRGAGLQEASISVSEFDASDIQALRIQNIADLSAYTPNLEINTAFAASNPTLFIRGIGLKDYNANSAGAVAIYQDGIYINSPAAQLFQLFDIESIAVLRGPQGSTNGRNATAGAILVDSMKPDGEFSSNGSFTYGNFNTIEADAAVGFPIAEIFNGTLSGRVAGILGFRDGYTKNACADWDPEAHGFLKVTGPAVDLRADEPGPGQSTVRDIYAALDPSAEKVEVLKQNGQPFPENDPRRFQYIYNNIELLEELKAAGGLKFNKLRRADTGEVVGRQLINFKLNPDGVCVIETPGTVTTPRGAAEARQEPDPADQPKAGDYTAALNVLRLEDFQGLKHKTNNVENWAGRGQLRYQGDTPLGPLDLLLNAHGGQNRGDSFHLQSVGAKPATIAGSEDEPLVSNPLGYNQFNNSTQTWAERETGLEKVEPRRGLNGPPGPMASGRGVAGADPFQGYYDRDGKEFLDLWGASLTGSWDLGTARIVSITGYETNERLVEDEGDDCPCLLAKADYENESWQVSQELRLEGEGADYSWLLGSYFIHEKLDSRNKFFDSLSFLFDQSFDQEDTGWNVFGQAHYDFLEAGEWLGLYQLSLEAGVRYNQEHKHFGLSTMVARPEGFSEGERFTLPPQSESGTWSAVTGDVTLSYNPIESATLYAKYTRGTKPGHFNAGLTVAPFRAGDDPDPTCPPGTPCQSISPVEPEFIHAAELGSKSSWFDDRLQLSVAGFRYWYEDLQVFDIVNEAGAIPTQQLLNADADVLGVEVELTINPIEGLFLEGGFGWLDSEFKDFMVRKQIDSGSAKQAGRGARFDYAGNPLIAAPEWNASGIVEYEIPLGHWGWGALVPRFDFSYRSEHFLDPQGEELIGQPAYWLFNGRLAYRTPGERIEIAGWVRNFMDETYKVDVFDLTREFNTVLEIWGEPRTYGFTVSYEW